MSLFCFFLSCPFPHCCPPVPPGSQVGLAGAPLQHPGGNTRVRAAQGRGKSYESQQVAAAARNKRRAGHGRRKRSLTDNYYFVCSDLGHLLAA